jgi:hypothetical protein
MIDTLTRRFVLFAALAPMATATWAADPASAPASARTYAVVSLIGDEFVVVSRRGDGATRLDPNERTNLPVPDPVFDRIAAAAVEKALLERKADTPVLRALIRDPRLFALQDKLNTESAESHDMRIALRDLLVKSGATDLILVTKQRGAPSFKVTDGAISGPGTLSGIGFYIDTRSHMQDTEQRMGGEGFLAPYAYLAVTQLDLGSMTVLKQKYGLETTMALPQMKQPGAHAWDAMTPQEKVDALEYVIRRAVATGMGGVLAQ